MNRTEYYRGKANIKYGIWNDVSKQFQFNISEDTPFLAIARLYQKIGDDAKKARFEPKRLPEKRDKVLRERKLMRVLDENERRKERSESLKNLNMENCE